MAAGVPVVAVPSVAAADVLSCQSMHYGDALIRFTNLQLAAVGLVAAGHPPPADLAGAFATIRSHLRLPLPISTALAGDPIAGLGLLRGFTLKFIGSAFSGCNFDDVMYAMGRGPLPPSVQGIIARLAEMGKVVSLNSRVWMAGPGGDGSGSGSGTLRGRRRQRKSSKTVGARPLVAAPARSGSLSQVRSGSGRKAGADGRRAAGPPGNVRRA